MGDIVMSYDTVHEAESESARHNEKVAKKKAARDKIMATKTEEKGLVIVHTGKGKGKSSAAFGMIFRCISHHPNRYAAQCCPRVSTFFSSR